ncbi:MAG TPA: glycosyltransferase family 4 protein [Actinomycetota bacterium]|jgi:glycosyltransferase involved in cell wall biosynthesis|nr:glycosyltransferase family 4 protein [Actinomycetota bacterium]
MRVLHVVASDQRRGAEMFAADLIRLLDVDVEQRVAVLRAAADHPVRYGAPATVLSSRGLPTPRLNVDLPAGRALAGLVRQWHPHIIQAHGGDALKSVVLAARNGNRRLVYRRIGAVPPSLSTARRAAYGLMMRRALRVVAVGEALRRETVEVFGVSPDRAVSIPNGVDSHRMVPSKSREEIRRELGIPPRAEVILSLGALTWEKDPLAHVETSARVLRARRHAFHVFVGEGPLRKDVAQAVARRGLTGRVRLLGARDDIPDLMTASDVLLLASRVEGMPGTAIEAGMAGVPVAAFAIAGIPEVVEDGQTGRLAAAGQVDELSDSVIDLLSHPASRRAMGLLAQERCRKLFDIRVVAPRYLGLYQELVAAKEPAAHQARER